MYCRHCGQEIEPMVICSKCGCASGYVEPVKPRETVKIKNLPVKILSAVGILVLLIISIHDIRLIFELPVINNWLILLVDVIGIAAFVSLICDKFKKIRIAYPIAEAFYLILLIFAIFVHKLIYSTPLSTYLWDALKICLYIILAICIIKKSKPLGIASIVLTSICYLYQLIGIVKIAADYSLRLENIIGWVICNELAVLLFAISIFLYIKSEIPKSEVKNTEVSL